MPRITLFTTKLLLAFSLIAAAPFFCPPAHAQDDSSIWQERQQQIRQVVAKLQPCVVAVGGGSGVIVSADGYVLTASHVSGATGRRLIVKLPNGNEVMATALGGSLPADTGALKLDGPGPWPFVSMEPSIEVNPVQRGQWCLAFGYPLSFPRGKPATVRMGRITVVVEDQLTADCPIMGGDSGGPLVNLNGDLIAISSRVKTDLETNIFVPIQTYRDMWQDIVSQVTIRKKPQPDKPRPWLGIFGDTDQTRVRIRKVQPDSPANQAGLLADDVIEEFDGRPVESFSDVVRTLRTHRPGDSINARLNRFGKTMQLSIKLGARP